MLTSQQILDLASTPPTGMTNGKVMAIARREKMTMTPSQRAFIDDLAQAPVARSGAVTYDHPANSPSPRRQDGEPLSPSDLAWIQRLPTDPTQVTHDDARALAGMAQSLSTQRNTADRRLVDQTWLPVRAMHDRNVAQLNLNAATAPPPIPSSALAALADAIAAETPVLQPQEAIARANEMLSNAAATRTAAHQTKVANARDKIAALDDAAKQRTAVVR